eukprot:gnl/TRDRNA2_/TRDRNA2_167608_c1_seq8.p1 gnl/TRDRNA2_/TRDRNA2_167608_c1~~gnl/TRDRNA2_/TRDRNA2_167608_c1_seq8.p1  ORF type:complete len:116 (+),score=24.96 gnl/TRDRNA2_/TRDRNA2_167608_c1_seq8:51-350(+)
MEELVPLIAHRVEEFRPRELVQVADAYARLPVASPELFALLADALPAYLYDLSPAEVAGLCRAFAEAAVYNAELTDALCMEVRQFQTSRCLIFTKMQEL